MALSFWACKAVTCLLAASTLAFARDAVACACCSCDLVCSALWTVPAAVLHELLCAIVLLFGKYERGFGIGLLLFGSRHLGLLRRYLRVVVGDARLRLSQTRFRLIESGPIIPLVDLDEKVAGLDLLVVGDLYVA